MSSKKVKTTNDAGSSSHAGESVIEDHGRRRSTCGYCKSRARSSTSHGLSAETLTVDDYQALIDRGWRRSGCYLYKHEMDKTCCPPYTIRLKARDFVPAKEQQRVSRRLERFLDGKLDVQPKEQTGHTGATSSGEVSDSGGKTLGTAKSEEKNKVEPIMDDLCKKIDQAVQRCIQSGEFPTDMQIPKASVKKVLCAKRKKLAEGPEQLLYTSNIAFPIAAAIRRKQTSEKEEMSNAEVSPESISEILLGAIGEISDMSIKVCKGHINFFSDSKDVVVPNGNISRGVSSTGEGEKTLQGTKKDSENHKARKLKLEINLKRSSFDPEEHELYKRYQLKVHNDKPDRVEESSYRRFLVDSPLIYVPSSSGNEKVPPSGFGSFHQQYRVDGRLIAVGVVDILPKCLSSVYLFWDPDYAFLSLGKYSAMQEINWVRENQAHCSSLQYYYLGYYIHSCNKMRYKAAYRPSELLCPLRFQWVSFEVAKPLLDKKPYVILSDITTSSQNQCSLQTLVETTTSEHEDMEQEETNDHFMACSDDDDDDDEMDEIESEDSDPGSIDNILIGLYGSQYRYKVYRRPYLYPFRSLLRLIGCGQCLPLSKSHLDNKTSTWIWKDLRHMMTPVGRKQLEPMLHSYRKVVGEELSERMVYVLR